MNRGSPLLTACLALVLAPALLCGCGGRTEDDRPVVAVSLVPQAYVVEKVAGPHFRVVALVGPGESPASYQPTDAQVSEIMRSRVYFRIGVPFENGAWLEAIEESPEIRIVDVRHGIRLREMAPHANGHGEGQEPHGPMGKDPHIWLDPSCLKTQAETVCRTLVGIDPQHEETYRRNLQHLLGELDQVDEEIRELLAPFAGRRFYVFHPAWGYFCDAYGVVQVPIEFEGKEPSEKELSEIIRRAREDHAKVVFVQSQITAQSAKAVADVIGARIRYLDPLARDVPKNLLEVARAIADSMR